VRAILDVLVAEGTAPPWLRKIERVTWSGPIKDLRFISGAATEHALLVDDMESYVHPEQRAMGTHRAVRVALSGHGS
jgi:hypothetical protein